MAEFVCTGEAGLAQCEMCAAPFVKKFPKARTCGQACGNALSHQVRSENSQARRKRACRQCGVEFTMPRQSARALRGEVQAGLYCSKVCGGAAKRLYSSKAEAKRAEERRARDRKGLPPPWVSAPKECARCGSTFIAWAINALFCSDECRSPKRPRISKRCACGAAIIGTAAKRTCARCLRRKVHAVRKHRQRARKFNVEYEPINPLMVFDRDRWRCQVCGVKTPKRLRGSFDDRAPELDHRIPMAMGGGHTWTNVQCACRRCNGMKGGTKALGQMALFASPA